MPLPWMLVGPFDPLEGLRPNTGVCNYAAVPGQMRINRLVHGPQLHLLCSAGRQLAGYLRNIGDTVLKSGPFRWPQNFISRVAHPCPKTSSVLVSGSRVIAKIVPSQCIDFSGTWRVKNNVKRYTTKPALYFPEILHQIAYNSSVLRGLYVKIGYNGQ